MIGSAACSRGTAVRGVFVLGLLFGAVGWCVTPRLIAFLLAPAGRGAKLHATSISAMPPHFRFALACAAAGAAGPLGALIWSRFARRAPYLKRIGLLLCVALLCAAAAALTYRAETARAARLAASLKVGLLAMAESLPLARIPLIGGAAALGVGAILGAVSRRVASAAPPRPAPGEPTEK